MYRNKTEKTSGHVFQGRYKAVIVEHNSYAGILSRYIHLNPVHLKKYDNLSLNEKNILCALLSGVVTQQQ